MNKDQFIQACISAMGALLTKVDANTDLNLLVKAAINCAEALKQQIDDRIIIPIP